MNLHTRFSFEIVLFFILFMFGLIYVGNAWSPSSYGVFLQEHDPQHTGVLWGKPRAIRSDEWAVVTPLTQATVNNKFERYNNTSFYREDLRINYGLPIFDWGLVFKPTMWGYLFLKPAMAYSLNWYLIFVLFIVGYFKLFNSIGMERLLSLSVSVTLYFSTFSQFWWDEKGPVIAFFPWLVYLLLSKLKLLPTLLLFYWLSASWLITDFYPPTVISLGFVGAVLFICYGQHWLTIRKLVSLAITIIASVVTTLFYLKEYLLKTSQTLYPGHRSIDGGSLAWSDWLSQIFPFSTFDKDFNVFGMANICEVGAVGVPFLLMILVHINYKNPLKKSPTDKERSNIYICLVALLLVNLWMLAPVPSWMGKLFLWDNVHPVRMKYAAGVMLAICTLTVSNYLNFIVNIKRYVVYTVLILIAWYLTKLDYSNTNIDAGFFKNIRGLTKDLYFIPGILIAYIIIKYFKQQHVTSFVICSAIVSAIVIAPFNPIQSANAIFSDHKIIKNKIDEYVNPVDGTLAINGYPGATLNGLGYKSVTHVTAVPALMLWKKLFPNMNESEFQHIFNRYSHIHLANTSEPNSPQPDVVEVPFKKFVTRFYLPAINDGKIISLSKGDRLSGSFDNLPPGELTGFSPLIGNYGNTSKGVLLVKVCNSGVCEEAQVDLEKSTDNAYVPLFLHKKLKIYPQARTTYEFMLKSSADTSLALWSSNTTNSSILSINDINKQIKLIPNLEVNYAQ
ncbi:hypothetical protein [Erwinia tasmaniensis]|uniref:DUF7657 domain-containing protein n=1 Tax=Erwinia tasmaniensis TaxID=338565 RepID=UPI003A4E23D5